MDNLLTEDGNDILGLFQESYNPIGLHVDAGFNFENHIYKQTLIPLTYFHDYDLHQKNYQNHY